MQFKLVIYTSTKVIYMIVSEDELDSIYNQYSDLSMSTAKCRKTPIENVGYISKLSS